MSLEMYLFKCNKDAYESDDRTEIAAAFRRGLKTFWSEESELSPTMVYWNYANQIYNWFLEHTNVDVDSRDYVEISQHEVLELLQTCHRVLNTGIDDDGTPKQRVCEKLLPTLEGPCFGETEYDEHYVETIKWTFERVHALFASLDYENEVLLFDLWW